MARQYSPTQFFCRVPKGLLARYFKQRHGVLGEIDFEKPKLTDVDPIFGAFTVLPDSKQAEIEAECQDIDNMACQGGVTALADDADFHQDQDLRRQSRRSTASTKRRCGPSWSTLGGGLPPPS